MLRVIGNSLTSLDWSVQAALVRESLRTLEAQLYYRSVTSSVFHHSLSRIQREITFLNTVEFKQEKPPEDRQKTLVELSESAERVVNLGKQVFWEEIDVLSPKHE